jgi:hypothetical protein
MFVFVLLRRVTLLVHLEDEGRMCAYFQECREQEEEKTEK